MLVLDSDVVIEIERQNPEVISALNKLRSEHPGNLAISSAVYSELYYGALKRPKLLEHTTKTLQAFESLPFDSGAAEVFSKLKFYLDKKGAPIPVMDLITASATITAKADLVSRDAHFKNVPGLKVILL